VSQPVNLASVNLSWHVDWFWTVVYLKTKGRVTPRRPKWMYSQEICLEPTAGGEVWICGVYTNKQTNKTVVCMSMLCLFSLQYDVTTLLFCVVIRSQNRCANTSTKKSAYDWSHFTSVIATIGQD